METAKTSFGDGGKKRTAEANGCAQQTCGDLRIDVTGTTSTAWRPFPETGITRQPR
jgi:hypothetical protein